MIENEIATKDENESYKLDLSHLVTEDDEPVDPFSGSQQRLLVSSLYTTWSGSPGTNRSFIALANVGLFYDVHQQAVVPDVQVSIGVRLPAEA